jgi:hypothetical protein
MVQLRIPNTKSTVGLFHETPQLLSVELRYLMNGELAVIAESKPISSRHRIPIFRAGGANFEAFVGHL